mmetsp:Transcript_21314/g.41786  ORF Transcript_21314/g.41786 Transcript_21314/m.41786 type:complete len:290 (+) Transcript_21314:861-1730(+)
MSRFGTILMRPLVPLSTISSFSAASSSFCVSSTAISSSSSAPSSELLALGLHLSSTRSSALDTLNPGTTRSSAPEPTSLSINAFPDRLMHSLPSLPDLTFANGLFIPLPLSVSSIPPATPPRPTCTSPSPIPGSVLTGGAGGSLESCSAASDAVLSSCGIGKRSGSWTMRHNLGSCTPRRLAGLARSSSSSSKCLRTPLRSILLTSERTWGSVTTARPDTVPYKEGISCQSIQSRSSAPPSSAFCESSSTMITSPSSSSSVNIPRALFEGFDGSAPRLPAEFRANAPLP